MPILKVPVCYNFGIVSRDEHEKLHQRLVTEYLKKCSADFKRKPLRNPFELTEKFIENFNNASETERNEAFIDLAKKMLARCKRRLGLNVLGCGKYVNLPVAWTEAIMLSQCKGEISEEALEILGISLDHAPIAPEHISILFFVAECILYKLCYDAAQKSYLFSCEIKLLKTSTNASSAAELNSKQKQFRIKQFLWHSLLVWVCVHNGSSEIDAVLMHVLFYKEQLHQKNWLESVLALMVLGESAKLNMSCLKVLMDLVKYFISSSVPLQKQEKNNKKKMSCWHWQVGYIYTNILREICLHGINADLQKTAFLGFCDCGKEHDNDKELRGANFPDLLNFCLPSDDYNDPFWVIRYGVIYNLVILRSELLGDVNREGLRNAVWRTLQKQKGAEKDSRVLDAAKVAEVETKGQINTSLSSKEPSNFTYLLSTQCIGWRVTTAMCHHFLPPIGPNIPLSHLPKRKPVLLPHQKLEPVVTEKKNKRLSLREELLQAGVPKYPYPDYLTRTDMELRRIINAQWKRELQIRLKLEEKLQELELQAKQRLEEEHFRQIMIWRLEKLHKTTKPYELPFKHEDQKAIDASSGTQLSNV